MGAIQTFLFNILSLVFILAALLMVVQNLATPVTLNITTHEITALTLGGAMAVCALLVGLGANLWWLNHFMQSRFAQHKVSRKAEKMEISAESAGQQVKALQAKVDTLEKALETALARQSTVVIERPEIAAEKSVVTTVETPTGNG
ncbi:MAG: hypothetical protein AB7P76_03000 [Candidatus Melainabacteria bacterium]